MCPPSARWVTWWGSQLEAGWSQRPGNWHVWSRRATRRRRWRGMSSVCPTSRGGRARPGVCRAGGGAGRRRRRRARRRPAGSCRGSGAPFAGGRGVRPQRLVHHREGVRGQRVLAGRGCQQHVVAGAQPAAAAQRGRDHDVRPDRHGDHAARIAARDHHPGVGGDGQPVTAPPAQRGDGHPVSDPARGVDPAEPVDHVRPARRAGQRYRAARARIALPAAGGGTWITGATGRAVMAGSRTGGSCAAGGRGGREGRPPGACSSGACFGEISRFGCPRGDLNPHGGAASPIR